MIGFCLFNMMVNLTLVIKAMGTEFILWVRKKIKGEEDEESSEESSSSAAEVEEEKKEEVKEVDTRIRAKTVFNKRTMVGKLVQDPDILPPRALAAIQKITKRKTESKLLTTIKEDLES